MSWEANLRSSLVCQQSLGWSQLLITRTEEKENRHELKELNTHGWTVRPRALAGHRDESSHWTEERLGGVTGRREPTRRHLRFSAASPMMIFPPLLLVFSTESAVLRPCSCFPRPWPSLKPYFCIILWATVPLHGAWSEKKERESSGLADTLYS